jgi:hypothetical protein
MEDCCISRSLFMGIDASCVKTDTKGLNILHLYINNMEQVAPKHTERDVEIALRMLDKSRAIQRASYYRHRDERLAKRKAHYHNVEKAKQSTMKTDS